MKPAFSLNMDIFYKAVVSLLVVFLLSGCDPCREPLEKQAKQHKSELDTKHTEMNSVKDQVLVLDSEIEHQKQVTKELKTAYSLERTELQERLNKQHNELELRQQTLDQNRLESSQIITQLEQDNSAAKEKIISLDLNIKKMMSDIEQINSIKEEVEAELENSQINYEQILLEKQTLHESHENVLLEQQELHQEHVQTLLEQEELQHKFITLQERIDVTQSVLVERGLQLAEQKKALLAVIEERAQLQQELSDREVQLPPMYESSDPKAQIELNVLYTHLVAEQKQRAWLKNKLVETEQEIQQMQKKLAESDQTVIANKELAGSWEQKQTESVEQIAELSSKLENISHNFLENKKLSSKQQQEHELLSTLHKQIQEQLTAADQILEQTNEQLTTANQTLEKTSEQLIQRDSEVEKLRIELQAGHEKNTLLLESENALQAQLDTVVSVKNESLLMQESFGQELAETTVQLEQTQMQLSEKEQLLESNREKINVLNNEREELHSSLTKLENEFEQNHLKNAGVKKQYELDLHKADIKREEFHSSLTKLNNELEQSHLQNAGLKKQYELDLHKADIKQEELQSNLNSLNLNLKEQQMQLGTAVHELETTSIEIKTINAENKQLTDDINASEQQRSVLSNKLAIELNARLEAEAKAREIHHIVQPGESLSNISKKYYGDIKQWKKILDANGLGNADVIQPGQDLLIPQE